MAQKKRLKFFVYHIEYQPFDCWSGRRGSNPRPSAWKANALSTELLPH